MAILNTRDAYRLDPKPLSAGGQAEVFPATVKDTGQQIALKRFFRGTSSARSRREIEILQQFDHPNIVEVVGYDEDAYSWYTMPLADGSLAQLGPNLEPRHELVALVEDILSGLEAAHASGVVHRDLNPRNILRFSDRDSERWVIADWGLVRRPLGQTTENETKSNASFGTQGFIAPEAYIDAHNVDERADIYGVGRSIGWALTGKWPAPNLPIDLTGPWEAVISQTTAQAPEDRPGTVADVRRLLRQVQRELDRPRRSNSAEWEQVEWDDNWIPVDEVHLRTEAWDVLKDAAASICEQFSCEQARRFPYAYLQAGGEVHILLQQGESNTYSGVEFTAGEWFRVPEGALSPLSPRVLFELGRVLEETRIDCIFRQPASDGNLVEAAVNGWHMVIGMYTNDGESDVTTLWRVLTPSETTKVMDYCRNHSIRVPVDNILNFGIDE